MERCIRTPRQRHASVLVCLSCLVWIVTLAFRSWILVTDDRRKVASFLHRFLLGFLTTPSAFGVSPLASRLDRPSSLHNTHRRAHYHRHPLLLTLAFNSSCLVLSLLLSVVSHPHLFLIVIKLSSASSSAYIHRCSHPQHVITPLFIPCFLVSYFLSPSCIISVAKGFAV
jgi:hypothetical protein